MRAIFLTRVTSATIGGLGGAIARIARTDHSLTLVGPPGTRHLIASMRSFIRGILGFKLIESRPQAKENLEAIYEDENITVFAFPVTPKLENEDSENQHEAIEADRDESSLISEAETPVGLSPDGVRRAAVYHMFKSHQTKSPSESVKDEVIADDRERWIPNWLHEKQLPQFLFPRTYPQSSSLAYVVVGPRPSPEKPHPVVIILDVPSPDLAPSIIHSFNNECAPFLHSAQSSNAEYKVMAIYHLLGSFVISDSNYYRFLRSFPRNTRHFISCPELSPDFFTFPHNAWRLFQLTRLDSEMFALLKRRLILNFSRFCLSLPATELMRPGLQIRLDQDFLFTGPIVYNFGSRSQTQASILRLMPPPEEARTAFTYARYSAAHHPDAQRDVKRMSVKVACLGTGKSIPNEFRNVISTLLLTPDGLIMLDCGEGTVQQIDRLYGVVSRQMVPDVKCIFISHAHADHHLGLISLLRRRVMNREKYPPKKPLYIVATRLVHLFLKEYQDLEDIGLSDDPSQNGVIQIISDALNYRHDEYPTSGPWRMLGSEPWLDLNLSRQRNLAMCENLNLASFETIDVRHATRAFGALIRHNTGWSITYSGDTRPTINLVKLGYGTDLLIHEASLKHGAEATASERGHSTIGQAIQVGGDMAAKNVLLTHLLGTAVTLPHAYIAKQGENTDHWTRPVVGVANDLMEIDVDKFWKANLYTRAIAQCHKTAFAQEKKSIGELLWEYVPEESMATCPNIEWLPRQPRHQLILDVFGEWEKSVAELLWKFVPEESMVCCRNIEWLPRQPHHQLIWDVFGEGEKSVAELLWKFVPKESKATCPDIAWLHRQPRKRTVKPLQPVKPLKYVKLVKPPTQLTRLVNALEVAKPVRSSRNIRGSSP